MPDPEISPPPARPGPAILIVIGAVGLILGIGRCGFLAPVIRGEDDYGISGACFIVVSLLFLIYGSLWLVRRRSK